MARSRPAMDVDYYDNLRKRATPEIIDLAWAFSALAGLPKEDGEQVAPLYLLQAVECKINPELAQTLKGLL